MTNIRKTIALLLCLCMLWGTAALAEDAAAATDTATTAVTELNDTDVLATVNGEEVSWDEVKSLYSSLVSQYGSAYDLTQQANVDLFRAVALENRLTEVLMEQKAKEFGVDQLTDEEIADLESQADTNWEDAIANYEAYFYPDLTEESSEEEKAAAREEAINYYKDQGYTLESLREEFKRYGVLNKIADIMVQDATVTDQEVEDLYQSLVAADKELYENDIAAYEAYNSYVDQMAMYAALYGTSSNLDHAWYKPDGFRAVKHILLPVDSELMTTYTDAPWYDMYMDIEYKLEETTTHLHFFEAKDSILQSYATPVGEWGLRLALITLVCVIAYAMVSRVRMRRRARLEQSDGPSAVLNHSEGAAVASTAGLWALYTLLTLAPMTGLLDSPLYSFSGSFLKLPRYTIQWFLLACGMICGALSALETLWPPLVDRMQGALSTRMKSLRQAAASIRPALLKLPACLCVLLCLLGVVKGTNQTGYTNTFYRYSRDVMESERILLDNGFRERYGMLMAVAEHVKEDQKILITRVGYQYPLRGRGYVLTTNPIVPLMNLPLEEVGEELAKMNVAMLATEPDFWDERYYPLSTLADYLEALPADQIVETEDMRLYLLDRSLIPYALAAKD